MSLRIDAHQHFWRYDTARYPWIGTDMGVLRRDWLPCDLRPLLDAHGIDACIAVQARAVDAETDFLLDLANRNDWIAAVIGWVDLRAEDLVTRLARWQDARSLAGFRHPLQDHPDVAAALADVRFDRGVRQLQDRRLVYEVLVRGASQLEQVRGFCARHDRHWLVLGHLGKPAIGGDQDRRWHAALRELASMPQVMCKLSGLVTEVVAMRIDTNELRRYLDSALELFGPQRLLFGSDWPVCLLRASYAEVVQVIHEWSLALSAEERALLWGGNAMHCYGVIRAGSAPVEASRCN